MRLRFFGDVDKKGTDDQTGTLSKLESLYKICDGTRQQYETEWQANAMFVEGTQWDDPVTDQRQWPNRRIPLKTPETKVKVTDNWLYALLRQGVAGLRDNLGQQIAIPSTTEIEDVLAAEIGTDFLQFCHDEHNEFTKRYRELLHAAIYGRGMSKVIWDPDIDGEGENGKLRRAGDISRMTLSPMQYYVDPWSSAFEECEFVIEVMVKDVEEVNALFPGHELKEEDYQDATRLLDVVAAGGGASIPKRKGACILKAMSVRPRERDLRKGRLIYWTKDAVLDIRDLPDALFPYQALDWFPMPGRNIPLSFVKPLRDLQRRYNILLSQIFELANRQLRGDIAVRGSGEITEEEDEETGQKRIYIGAGVDQFEFMKYDLNPQTAAMLMAQLFSDAQQLAGVRDPSMGKNPPGVRTSSALLLLKEADTAGLSLFRTGFDQAYCQVARQKLVLARNHYKTARMIRTVGTGNRLEKVQAFFGAELRNTRDVRTRPIPFLTEAEKRQIKQEQIAAMLYGPYLGPQDQYAKMKALVASGLPGVEDEVEQLCAPLTMEELRELAGRMNAEQAGMMMEKIAVERMVLKAQIQGGPQAMMGPQQGQPPPQQVAGPQGAM